MSGNPTRTDAPLAKDALNPSQPCRDPLADDADTSVEWLWARSIPVSRLPAEVTDRAAAAVLDAYDWTWMPKDGCWDHDRPIVNEEMSAIQRRGHGPADRRGELNPSAKLDTATVRAMRERYAAGETVAAIARDAGVSWWTAEKAITSTTWAHVK